MNPRSAAFGPAPRQQPNWDWRAAGNFMLGGAGSGAIVMLGLPAGRGWPLLLGLALVGLGLACVWLEIGRPWRALHVFFNPRQSWMSRESIAAALLMAAGAATLLGLPIAPWLCAPLALVFVYCQGRLLQAAKGIVAWREPLLVPLIVATGLAEGGGLLLGVALPSGTSLPLSLWVSFSALLLLRAGLWFAWRGRLRTAAGALRAIDAAGRWFVGTTVLALAAAALAVALPLPAAVVALLQLVAGAAALGGGLWFKFTLVTRAAFTQGFALPHLPVRGVRRS